MKHTCPRHCPPKGPWLVLMRLHVGTPEAPSSWIAPAAWNTQRRHASRWRARLSAWGLNRRERAYLRACRRARHQPFGPGTSWEVAHTCERPPGTPERHSYDPIAAVTTQRGTPAAGLR